MDKKVILISIDGMRADGVQVCGNTYVEQLKKSAVKHLVQKQCFRPLHCLVIGPCFTA